ncbi:MAG: ROK family glucokinase [Micrococcales bacterium]|nr:ROK family glucokinase [Micrococcales bacterium]MCL2668694.1 ROK family glucokinase [Micrococcales bacterium]
MHAIGVDVGGTKIAAGVVTADGQIVAKTTLRTDRSSADSVDAGIVAACESLLGDYDVTAVGLAAPGFISADRTTVHFAPNLPWRDHPLRQNVARRLGIDTVAVENDASAAGWAESRFGAAKGLSDVVMLTLGTGLGGAIITGGALVRGAWGMAAEIGHMRVVPEGHHCGCGQEGCWEQYVSGSALVREAQAVASSRPVRATRLLELAGGKARRITGVHITKAAREGDELSLELLAWIGRWVGEGAASLVAVLDPQIVVVGGGLSDAGDMVLVPARYAFERRLSAGEFRPLVPIEVAALGNDAGIVGAADLAWNYE